MNELSAQTELFNNVAHIIEQARQRVRTAVNTAMVYAYFEIGRHIVEHEQKGDARAEYGKALLKELSAKLTARFGEGWGYAQLKNIRQFYLVYQEKANQRLAFSDYSSAKKAKQRLANLQSTYHQTMKLVG